MHRTSFYGRFVSSSFATFLNVVRCGGLDHLPCVYVACRPRRTDIFCLESASTRYPTCKVCCNICGRGARRCLTVLVTHTCVKFQMPVQRARGRCSTAFVS
ncbi:hypothetical protein DM02DRAFT_373580 [Periconia macrospinosa]|uniref:Uncharacterized protein n=1 Tax=Periconia macrospinosa TaxID=97972 RepID=A0A2V1DRY6_9PLEO|nr:hypothetical protein DM02DRAFT_373580 [Periconia macrospinosa]